MSITGYDGVFVGRNLPGRGRSSPKHFRYYG
jgi:hypothetical protein